MKNPKLVAALATLLVAGLVVAGLFAVGSPATARKLRQDQLTRDRILQLHSLLVGHVSLEDSLPPSLEEVSEEAMQFGYSEDVLVDPGTGELFEYERESARRYSVCTTFFAASDDDRVERYGFFYGELSHEAGRDCFDFRVTDEDLDSAPLGRSGPFPVVEPPADREDASPESPAETPESAYSSPSPGTG